jgi:plasmid stabilization system protein ParE
MAKGIVWTEQARADLREIEQQTALRILKTLARYARSGEGDTKQLQGIEPPMNRLRAQDHRIFFRDKGEYLEIPAYLIAKRLTAKGLRSKQKVLAARTSIHYYT